MRKSLSLISSCLLAFPLLAAACGGDDDSSPGPGDAGAAGSTGGASPNAGSGGRPAAGSTSAGAGSTTEAGTGGSLTSAGAVGTDAGAGGTGTGDGGSDDGGHAGTGGSVAGSGTGGGSVAGSGTGGGSVAGSGTGGGSVAGSGSGGDSVAGSGGGGVVVTPDVLDNPDFEKGDGSAIPGWTHEGTSTAAFLGWSDSHNHGVNGTNWGRLGHWQLDPYTVSTSQEVNPLPDGTYTFGAWVKRSPNFVEQHLFARGYSSNPSDEMVASTASASSSEYTYITLSGIPVTSGRCVVGFYSEAALTDVWANIDDVTFTKDP